MVNPANAVIEPEFILMPAGLTETTYDLAIHGVDITQTISITPAEGFWTSYSDTIEIIPAMFPESERQALIDLYNSTDGSNWNRSDNWLGERGTECSWSGVICDDYNLHVTYIFLENNNLNGEIPDTISNLQRLSELVLTNNQLRRLPESFGNLQNLSLLELSVNRLSNLPENFGNLQNLEKLILSNNQLIKLPENFTELDKADEGQDKSKLDYLDLSINQLENLPQNFERLKYISYLDISANHIKNIPSNIGDLPKLTYFSIANNDIEIIPESIGKCTNVSTLNLSYNHLKIIPSSLGNLKRLQYFDTSNNKIEELPETLKYLSNLQTIDLSNNEIQAFPYYLSHIKNLQELYLSDNNIGEINDDIQDFTHLVKLNLSGNSYLGGGGVNDTGHCHDCISSKIGMLKNLQFMDLSGCHLTDPVIPEELFHLNNLRYLSMSDNQLGVIPEHIANLRNLVSLSLAQNFISKLDKSVCNLLNLESLDVSGNKWLNGDIPLEFSKLTHLVFFDSDDTKLYTTSPALEKFITEISPEWINAPPPLTERQDLCISFITTNSDHLATRYFHGQIPMISTMMR
jgi:Leucine-rich repeat (LRR) protein